MENQNKINKQLSVSDLTTQTYKTTISTAVVKAFARTGKECNKESIELITNDVIDEYNNLPIEAIIEALKKGGRGKYGRTFLLSVQEICIWIDSYLKETSDEIDNNIYKYFRFPKDHYLIIRRVSLNTEINNPHEIIETDRIGQRNKQW